MEVYRFHHAIQEFDDLDEAIQVNFLKIFDMLEKDMQISKKFFKKIKGSPLFEARVKDKSGVYRGLGGKVKSNFYFVSFFKKKSQKLPKKELKTAARRYKQLLTELGSA